MSNRDTALAWRYHELTKHSYWSVRRNAHFLDFANMPRPFKIYPELEPIKLSTDLLQSGASADTATGATGALREGRGKLIPTLEQLTSILYYSAGVTKKKVYPGGTIYFRAAACAGALYPVETYVVCGDLEGLPAGVYHFNPGDFSLRRLREGDHRGVLVAATAAHQFDRDDGGTVPVTLVYTAISWRSTWKYQNRAYRYHFWDNGTIAANALVMASSHGFPAGIRMGFIDARVEHLLGIDGQQELPLSLLEIGNTKEKVAPHDAPLPELRYQTVPLSESQVDYPLIYETHRASALIEGEELLAWLNGQIAREEPEAVGEVVPLPDAGTGHFTAEPVEAVIQRRASTRRFARQAMPFEDLSAMLNRATAAVSANPLSPFTGRINDIYIIVNRVEGLEPGAYYYREEDRALELLKAGEFSDKAAYLALEQELAGDACATLFFMADLKTILDRLGNRGYRMAQMEAGILGGRVYLAAYAQGRGATGLTFYDDDVTEFFSPHAAGKGCIFVTSVGIPGKRPLF